MTKKPEGQNNHCLHLKIGMLDLIITSYKLTINLSSYLQEYIHYPVDDTYNIESVLPSDLKKLTIFFAKKKKFKSIFDPRHNSKGWVSITSPSHQHAIKIYSPFPYVKKKGVCVEVSVTVHHYCFFLSITFILEILTLWSALFRLAVLDKIYV